MSFALPQELRSYIDDRVQSGEYGNTSEYLRELIRKQRDVEKLRGLLMDGLNSGPPVPMEADFFDKLREKARTRVR